MRKALTARSARSAPATPATPRARRYTGWRACCRDCGWPRSAPTIRCCAAWVPRRWRRPPSWTVRHWPRRSATDSTTSTRTTRTSTISPSSPMRSWISPVERAMWPEPTTPPPDCWATCCSPMTRATPGRRAACTCRMPRCWTSSRTMRTRPSWRTDGCGATDRRRCEPSVCGAGSAFAATRPRPAMTSTCRTWTTGGARWPARRCRRPVRTGRTETHPSPRCPIWTWSTTRPGRRRWCCSSPTGPPATRCGRCAARAGTCPPTPPGG